MQCKAKCGSYTPQHHRPHHDQCGKFHISCDNKSNKKPCVHFTSLTPFSTLATNVADLLHCQRRLATLLGRGEGL